jgi:hypothetical protein
MPTTIAILDTNVYYRLSEESAKNLKVAERRSGIVACGAIWVALELISHLADPADPQYMRCGRAIRAFRVHTELWNGRAYIPFIGSPKDALSEQVFGWRDPFGRRLSAGLGDAIMGLTQVGGLDNVEWRLFCADAKEFLQKNEERFGSRLSNVVETLGTIRDVQGNPLTESDRAKAHHAFHREHGVSYVAETIAMALADRAGKTLDAAERVRLGQLVLTVMPVAVHFFKNELRRFAGEGADPTAYGNSNSVWDLEISSLASPVVRPENYSLLGVAKPQVVTDERRIGLAAKEAGHPSLVIDRAAYLTSLGLDDTP